MQVIKYVFQPHGDDRGQLVALEEFKDIPFKIKRVYYIYDTLKDVIVNGNWANYAGNITTLGLVSGDDPTANYVQIPMDTTQWNDGFTQDDYKALVADMFSGKVTVSNDIAAMPAVSAVKVNDLGNLK